MQPKLICYKNKRNGKKFVKNAIVKTDNSKCYYTRILFADFEILFPKKNMYKNKIQHKSSKVNYVSDIFKKMYDNCFTTNVKHNKTTHGYFI